MQSLRKFLSFANDFSSRSPEGPIDKSQSLKNGQKLKLSTPAASGKPKVLAVDEEFRQSITSACFNTKLCPQCKALNIGERIAEVVRSPENLSIWPQFNASLPTIDESCDFCQLYKNLYSLVDSKPNFRCFEVQLLNERHCSVLQSCDLSITKHGKTSGYSDVQLMRGENGPGLRCPETWPISRFGVDYDGLRRKLAFCDERGAKYNQKDTLSPAHPIFVINCHTRQVEPLVPGTKYVCLSYVWGPPQGDNPDFGCLPNPTETTVEDAITVTSKLDYTYLWVDKYCINQKDGEMKMAQIQQMDYIYTQADLTVVAAAGDRAGYGLPGVSKQPRSPRRSLRLGNYVLMPCWEDARLKNALRQSKWMERGWTYQEALLSRRRLFFTEYCYLHDCGTCYVEGDEAKRYESWVDSPELVKHGRLKGSSRWMAYNISSTMPDVCGRIEEYSRRDLSHQSDALNAITGVLQTFEHANPPEFHYYGVPMLQPFEREAEPLTSNMDGFVQSLRWNLDPVSTRKRRTGFPSWSWVGWECPCQIQNLAPIAPTTVRVEVELSPEEVVDWTRFAEMEYLKQNRTNPSSHYIWVEAWTFELTTLDAPPPFEEDVQRAHIMGNPNIDHMQFKARIDLFCKDSAEERERLRTQCEAGKLLAVVLGDISKEVTTRSIIIVEEVGDVFQRVGNFDDTGRAMVWNVGPSFWERDIVNVRRQWVRLS